MQYEIVLRVIMTKGKRKKAKRITHRKARHFRPREKGRNVLIMCVISILMLGGTYISLRSQKQSTGYAHIDTRLIGIELAFLGMTVYSIVSWWKSR
jgi:hypothetical protein